MFAKAEPRAYTEDAIAASRARAEPNPDPGRDPDPDPGQAEAPAGRPAAQGAVAGSSAAVANGGAQRAPRLAGGAACGRPACDAGDGGGDDGGRCQRVRGGQARAPCGAARGRARPSSLPWARRALALPARSQTLSSHGRTLWGACSGLLVLALPAALCECQPGRPSAGHTASPAPG